MRWGRRGTLLTYGLIALLAILSLVILFRLRSRFEATLTDRVNDLQRVFSNRALLKSPSDTRISFLDIEAEVGKYENRGDFGRIRIAKKINNSEHTVYPFYEPALRRAGLLPLNDNGLETSAPLRQPTAPRPGGTAWLANEITVERPLVADGQRLGTLFVNVNKAPLRTVSLVIWALGAMLAASLAFLATQFRRQEKVISATTIELEEKRRELVRLERLALAGQLSANILHDLKKPVLNIRNEAEEAVNPLDERAPTEAPREIFRRIQEQADFFIAMLKEAGFDRFVRAQEEREYVDLNELLQRSLALVRYEQASVQVEKHFAPDLPPVLADPIRVIQVFSNLILNAYQAMDGRGSLTLVTKHSSLLASVEIVDSGPGIPEALMTHIFEPFYTTKAPGQGTGLGLYIVRDIMLDLGGDVSVESRPGRTAFLVQFPMTR